MQPHTKEYYRAMNLSVADYVGCEVCQSPAVDIHHVIPRSKFGKKRKAEQDNIDNIIALCRVCHDKAHANLITKETLQSIISKR